MPFFVRVFAVIVFCLVLAEVCPAQVERYELGKRLRRAELAWEAADSAHRARATVPMSEAVRSFFGLQLRKAASQLDDAYFSIRGDQDPSDLEKVAISQRMSVAPLLSDAEQATLRIGFSNFTPSPGSNTA